MTETINFAHRGASAFCPENTMSAFSKAIALGATGIETDVQRTKDGVLVLIHDEALQRTAGDPRLVKDATYDELSALDAGSWFHPDYAGERIPKLEELLGLACKHGTMLNLELKNGVVSYEGMEAEVIAQVREFGMSDRVILSSFNHYSLYQCKMLASDIRTGILYMEGLFRPWDYAQTLHADALHAYHYAVLPEWVEEAAASGIAYHPFTVNDESRLEQLLEAKVAGIITDYPDRLERLLAQRRHDEA